MAKGAAAKKPLNNIKRNGGEGEGSGLSKPKKAWYGDTKKRAVGVDDMTMLSKVTNEQINDNLKLRFESQNIYTYIGHVLISVNPYRDLGIYTKEILESYTGKNRIEMSPHVYAVAEDAFRNMSAYSENQCVIISGESGAGKTEAAKKIMQYIAAVSGGESSAESVKDMLLATNPVLEAFGNAKTLRNNNSSRFGKYFEIEFMNNVPQGGTIHNYLLEKSRVSSQISGERNFHIFYQLCRGAPENWKTDFGLYEPEQYVYCSQAGCLDVPGIDDYSDFQETLGALNTIGVSEAEQYELFRLVSGIMWIGNLTFGEEADQAYVQDTDTLNHIASLLQIDAEMLTCCLRQRMVETKKGGKRGTLYNVPLNYSQAVSVRDALAKSIYNRIFDWLVERINGVLSLKNSTPMVIGVLDIYGFEIFNHNGFEQLCINYVNEKLQQIFIELTLKAEQEEYEREGIQWTAIPFFNNKIVCDLIEERRPPGIFAIMDDACATAHADPDAADRSLLQRLGTLQANAHFSLGGVNFIIKHYAGDVTYDGDGMTEKNKDQLVVDLLEVINTSESKFMNKLFPEKADRDSTKKPTTAGYKIRTSCNELVEALMQCNPHYVRCIKPNESKSPTEYDVKRCLHQVRYLGLLENIRVRRAGFAYRQVHEKFLERFFLLSRRTSYAGEYTWEGDAIGGTRCILEDCGIAKEEWQMGRSKTFLRHPETLWALEHLRERYWHNMAMKIQRAWRGFLRYRNECAIRIQRAFRSWVGLRTYLQMRDYGHEVLDYRKERKRFSLISMRRYLGDYIELRSDMTMQNACGPSIMRENIVFSSKCQILVHKLLRSSKPAPRWLALTDVAIYIIATIVEKNMARVELERRITLQSISSVSLSPYQDDYVVIHVPNEYDTVLATVFKTEFITTINWYMNGGVRVDISDNIEYFKKPGKKSSIQFEKSDVASADGDLKKNKVAVRTGWDKNSVSDPPCRRHTAAAQPITKGKLLKKGAGSGGGSSSSNVGSRPSAAIPAAKAKQAPNNSTSEYAEPIKLNKASSNSSKPKFKATFGYEKTDEGELSFPEGGLLEVITKDENGWWLAAYNGQQGWVPSNYLVEVEEAAKPAPAAVTPRAPAPIPAAAVKGPAAAVKGPAAAPAVKPPAAKSPAPQAQYSQVVKPNRAPVAPPASNASAPPPAPLRANVPAASKKVAPPPPPSEGEYEEFDPYEEVPDPTPSAVAPSVASPNPMFPSGVGQGSLKKTAGPPIGGASKPPTTSKPAVLPPSSRSTPPASTPLKPPSADSSKPAFSPSALKPAGSSSLKPTPGSPVPKPTAGAASSASALKPPPSAPSARPAVGAIPKPRPNSGSGSKPIVSGTPLKPAQNAVTAKPSIPASRPPVGGTSSSLPKPALAPPKPAVASSSAPKPPAGTPGRVAPAVTGVPGRAAPGAPKPAAAPGSTASKPTIPASGPPKSSPNATAPRPAPAAASTAPKPPTAPAKLPVSAAPKPPPAASASKPATTTGTGAVTNVLAKALPKRQQSDEEDNEDWD